MNSVNAHKNSNVQKILKLLEYVVCPNCHGKLRYDRNEHKLICENCRLAFPIVDGIPVLLLDKAQKVED